MARTLALKGAVLAVLLTGPLSQWTGEGYEV